MIRESYSDFRSWAPSHPINNEASLNAVSPFLISQKICFEENVLGKRAPTEGVKIPPPDRGRRKRMTFLDCGQGGI